MAAVRAFAADHPELPAIRGWGWSNVVAPGRGPTAAALDAAVADRPVRARTPRTATRCGPTALALRARRRRASDTPDPANGVIERDPATGRRRARLREGAQQLRAHERQRRSRATSAPRACATSSARSPARWASPRSSTRCSSPASRSSTPSKLCSATASSPCAFGRASGCAPTCRSTSSCGRRRPSARRHHGALFQADTVKLFADGVIEGHTAYLDEPYADTPGDRGFPEWPSAALERGLGGGRRRRLRAPLPRHRRRRHGGWRSTPSPPPAPPATPAAGRRSPMSSSRGPATSNASPPSA